MFLLGAGQPRGSPLLPFASPLSELTVYPHSTPRASTCALKRKTALNTSVLAVNSHPGAAATSTHNAIHTTIRNIHSRNLRTPRCAPKANIGPKSPITGLNAHPGAEGASSHGKGAVGKKGQEKAGKVRRMTPESTDIAETGLRRQRVSRPRPIKSASQPQECLNRRQFLLSLAHACRVGGFQPVAAHLRT